MLSLQLCFPLPSSLRWQVVERKGSSRNLLQPRVEAPTCRCRPCSCSPAPATVKRVKIWEDGGKGGRQARSRRVPWCPRQMHPAGAEEALIWFLPFWLQRVKKRLQKKVRLGKLQCSLGYGLAYAKRCSVCAVAVAFLGRDRPGHAWSGTATACMHPCRCSQMMMKRRTG